MIKDITRWQDIPTIPDVVFKERVAGEFKNLSTKDIFSNKKVLVFSLPGAFTPTCSGKQLPNFERLYEEFKLRGIDEVYCLSVNDSFVMNAWADELNVTKVKMFVEDGKNDGSSDTDPFKVSDVNTMLNYLKDK